MANDILEGTLQHECLSNEAIRAIVNQLREHPVVKRIVNPIVTPEDFTSCFKYAPEKTASSYSGRSVPHYKACSQIKEEGIGELLASVHATVMTVPLDAGFFPERWRKAINVVLEKIPGVIPTNKLRIIQLLEADLNQVLRSAFARNISKLAQDKYGIISEHQYGRSHQNCISPILKKWLTIQILIQNRTNGIVFDNATKGCYDRIISGIALFSIRRL
jgi:signal recognition particle subunit SEC65